MYLSQSRLENIRVQKKRVIRTERVKLGLQGMEERKQKIRELVKRREVRIRLARKWKDSEETRRRR